MNKFILGTAAIVFLAACGQAVDQSSAGPVNGNDQRVAADGINNAPTPTPTPVPTQTPTQSVQHQTAIQPAAQAPAPQQPAGTFNRIIGPGVNVGIGGSIGNCGSNFRTVPGGSAHFDVCQPGMWIDCDISTCPAINGWGVGTVVHYFDGNGNQHTYTIQFKQTGTAGQRMSVYGSVHFQVCQQNVSNGPVTVVSA